jgi:hypothetical protein
MKPIKEKLERERAALVEARAEIQHLRDALGEIEDITCTPQVMNCVHVDILKAILKKVCPR